MFTCILLRLNLDFCFQPRNIYPNLCLLDLKRCGWSPWSNHIWITIRIEKPTKLLNGVFLLYLSRSLYTSLYCSHFWIQVNRNVQDRDSLSLSQQYFENSSRTTTNCQLQSRKCAWAWHQNHKFVPESVLIFFLNFILLVWVVLFLVSQQWTAHHLSSRGFEGSRKSLLYFHFHSSPFMDTSPRSSAHHLLLG